MRKNIGIFVILSLCLIMIPTYAAAEELRLTNSSYIAKSNIEDNIAVFSLKQIAERDRTNRHIVGGSLLATGGGLVVLGVSLGDDAVAPLSITGGVVAGIGAVWLAVPSGSEKELKKVMLLSDSEEREFVSEEFLAYRADQAKKNRIISAATNAGLALYYIIGQPNHKDRNEENDMNDFYSGMACGAFSVYNFIYPSYTEKVYDHVKEVKGQKSISFKFGEFTGPVLSLKF